MPGGRSAQTGQQGFTPAPCPCRQPMVPPAEAMAMLVSLRAEPCARPGQGQRWPLPASTGRCWPVLAKSRSSLAQRPWASPAADPAGLSCRPPCSACPFDAWGLSRPSGGQAAVLQAERACPAACAPRHAATARPDPQGVCAVKGQPARQAFSGMRNFQATPCGQAGIASGGALLSLRGRFLAGTRQGRRLATLQEAVWRSFGHRRPSSQFSVRRIFFLMQTAGHGIMPTARRNESVAEGIREACGSAQTMPAWCARTADHAGIPNAKPVRKRPRGWPKVRLEQIVWRGLPGVDCLAERRSGGAALPGESLNRG